MSEIALYQDNVTDYAKILAYFKT